MPTIRPITTADLITLEPLLRASFGRDDFELQDELEAFADLKPRDWFVLLDGHPQGFIRHFPLDENLRAGELYVVPGPERARRLEQLLLHFLRHHNLPKNTTLRLDTLETDYELMGVLRSLFPEAATKTFARYQLRTSPRTSEAPAIAERPTEADLETTQAILAPLKCYTVPELQRLLALHQLFVFRDNGVKAALYVTPQEGKLEVVTLATIPTHLRRGYASALLKTFLAAHPDTEVILKVNVENTPAIELYERVGFTREASRTEVWWYLQL